MMLDLDFRAAFRSLLRSPGYLATALLSLGLGIGTAAAAFGVIDAVRLRELPFKDGNRLVLISEVPRTGPGSCGSACSVTYVTYANVLRPQSFQTMDALVGFTSGAKALGTGGEPLLVTGGVIPPSLFGLLGVKPELGRAFVPDDDRLGAPPVAILSHSLWVGHFGQDPGLLGQTVKLSDTHYTVIGVMPAGFDFEAGNQFWIPIVPTLDPSTRPSIRNVTVVGRLAPGRTLAQAQTELASIDPAALRSGDRTATPTRLEAAPLRDRYTATTASHDLIFAAIVACVLLIACANVANLGLVRTLNQQHEFALRAALGARPGRLARGLMVQNALLVLAAAGLGLLFAGWLLGVLGSLAVLQSLRPAGMDYRLDGRVALFTVLLALGVGVLLSLVSARVVARTDLQAALRDGAVARGGHRSGRRIQRLFVVTQIASSVVLLVGAGLLTRTVLRLSQLDLGFEAAPVVTGTPSFAHSERVKEKYLPVVRQIEAEFGRLPGASSVGLRATVPLAPTPAPDIVPEGQGRPLSRDLAPSAAFAITPGYFPALGVRMVRGRNFSEQDLEQTPRVAIVNEWAAARWWPGQDPIGRTIRIDTLPGLPMTLTVVGVARDNKAAQPNLLLATDAPELYRPYEQAPSPFMSFFVKSATPGALQKPVKEILARLVPDRPLFGALLQDQVDGQLSGVRINAIQILAFALIGLCLALTGIHGVLAYTVRQRTQEIGIRGALGATRGGIERMVLADAARLTVLGVLIGLPLAGLATRLIKGMLYGTSPSDPLVYGGVALAVAVVSVLAAYAPARRAARVDPLIALRAS